MRTPSHPATRFGPGHKFKNARAAFSANVPAPRHQFLPATNRLSDASMPGPSHDDSTASKGHSHWKTRPTISGSRPNQVQISWLCHDSRIWRTKTAHGFLERKSARSGLLSEPRSERGRSIPPLDSPLKRTKARAERRRKFRFRRLCWRCGVIPNRLFFMAQLMILMEPKPVRGPKPVIARRFGRLCPAS